MKVSVNKSICVGHALCAAKCPEIYTLDDIGCCDIEETVVPPELEAKAKLGAQACPEGAIIVVNE